MSRRLLAKFSGTHLTIIACTAILAPTALLGAVAYSNVALVNPTTGVTATVDGGGRLAVLDPYAFYRNYPANQVDIAVSNGGTQCETIQQWPVPSGKAFIITAISGYETELLSNDNYAGFYLHTGPNCSGGEVTAHFSSAPYAPVAADYGVGVPIPGGSTLSVYSVNNFGFTYIHGYLVPAALVTGGQLVPAAPSPAKRAALGR